MVFASMAVLIAVVLLAGCSSSPPVQNIFLISIDTLRADHLGCYGYNEISTPAIDRLARNGVRAENAFTPVPLTLPAHSSMLTGTSPVFHGVRNNTIFSLQERFVSLAEVLKKSGGYKCGAFVGAYPLDSVFGLSQGFKVYDDSYPPQSKNKNAFAQRNADETAREAIKWISKNPGSKKFVFLHFFDPHRPYTPPGKFAKQYRSDPYDGEIAFSDKVLSDFLKNLKKINELKHSLIVITSDHGEDLGDHGEMTHGFFIYDTTLKVPLIFNYRGDSSLRGTFEQGTTIMDIMPTVLDFLDLNIPGDIQGGTLMPEIEGKKRQTPPLYCETFLPRFDFGWSELQGIRTKHWKYIESPDPELYNLKKDPREKNNLIDTKPQKAAELSELLKKRIENRSGKHQKNVSLQKTTEKMRKKMLSLGYLTGGTKSVRDEEELRAPKNHLGALRTYDSITKRLSKGNYRKAVEEAIDFTEKYSEEMGSFKNLDTIKLYGTDEQINKTLDLLKSKGKHSRTAVEKLAYFQSKLGNCLKARESTNKLTKSGYATDENFAELGECFKKAGKLKEAKKYFQKARAMNRYSMSYQTALGVVYHRLGEKRKALEKFKSAQKRKSADPSIYKGFATIYEQTGKLDKARKFYSKALETNPKDPSLHFRIGMFYVKLNRPGRTRFHLKKFLSMTDARTGSSAKRAKKVLKQLRK